MVMTSINHQKNLKSAPYPIFVIIEMLTHETSGVGGVGANFAINFDQALLDDSSNFTASQGVF